MFVTKSRGSRILMLVINNHYRAAAPGQSSGDPQMISSYVKIFVRTSGPGAWDFGEGKSPSVCINCHPGSEAANQRRDSVTSDQ